MRYESFYPFSQPRGNDFFNFRNPAPQNTPPPPQNFFGAPNNEGAGGFATNLYRQFQQGLGNFQQGPSGDSGFQQGSPGGGFQQSPPRGGGFQQGPPGGGGFQQGPPGGGGFQQGAASQGALGGRTMSYLQTADKFINTAQQLTPMFRQWAPMIQNVPALFRLYRGFQAAPNVASTATAAAAATNLGAAGVAATAPVARAATSVTNGLSLPRIFQPPF